jgi:hypothetical protein
MNPVRIVAVFVENKPGETARITRIIAESGANVRWVTIASSGPFGVMKFLVDKCDAALEGLRQKGLAVHFLEVLAVEVKDTPGALQAVAETLGRHGVNVDNVSGFVANRRAVLLLETHDVAKAHAVLEKQGLRLLAQEEMLSL